MGKVRWSRFWRRVLVARWIALFPGLASAQPPIPDGVCYPVNGTGYVVTRTDETGTALLRIPIGTLSPLVEGDSLVVQTGTITFLDFRNGQSSVYGAGTRLTIPAVINPEQPSWWDRLVDYVMRSMSDPERSRIARISGSVRRGSPAFWPEAGRFAPGLPIVFKWWRVRPSPVLVRIEGNGIPIDVKVPRDSTGSGAVVWQPPRSSTSVRWTWSLVDAEGNRSEGGGFTVLTTLEANKERERYRRSALAIDVMPKDLAAAVIAAADSTYLW